MLGQKAMQALDRERKHDEMHINEAPQFFEQYIYSNVIPSAGAFLPNLDTTEEMQIIAETKQLLGWSDKGVGASVSAGTNVGASVGMSITCVRVPIKIGHVISVTMLMKHDVSDKQFEEMKKMMKVSRYVVLLEKASNMTPKDSIGYNQIIVSRLRKCGRAVSFVITYDNMTYRAYTALEVVEKLMGV